LSLFTNDPIDGTLLLENAVFVGESSVQVIDKAVNWPSISITEHPANLGFHFPYQPRIVESIRNLFLHVPLWFTMFLLAGIAFVGSVRQLGETGPSIHDERAEAATRVAVWFGVLGLITGSIWARGAWGAWWVDDPQLNGALVTVLVYSGYLVLRGSIDSPALRAKLSAVFNLFAFVILVILLLILPKFSESLHPGKDGSPAFNTYDLNNALRAVFYPAVIGWMLLSLWMYRITLRMQRLTHRTPEA
jgi:heme exporter protein C